MKKKELKKRIEDGFSQLAPDILETVVETAKEQELLCSQTEASKPKEHRRRGVRTRYALSACACFVMAFLCMLGVFVEKQSHVFLVLDINPSIRIELNEHRQVESIKGLNKDGKDVVKELKWKRKEPVQELLDVLLQDVVEKSYLRDNEGILVTLTAPCQDICENLEQTLEKGIDQKLTELQVSGVTTAFRHSKDKTRQEGRKLLETELAKCSDLDQEQAEQMSVKELIQYCQDYTSLELKLSAASNKVNEGQGQQNKDQTEKNPNSSSVSGEEVDPEEKKTETDNTQSKESQKEDSLPNRPETTEEDKKADEGNVQPETGKPEGENGKQDGEEDASGNGIKPGEQSKPVKPGNQGIVAQPEFSGGQEGETDTDAGDSQGQENGAEPGSPGIQENGTESGTSGTQENGTESDTSGTQENGTESDTSGTQENGTESDTSGAQGDKTKPNISETQGNSENPEESGVSENETGPGESQGYENPESLESQEKWQEQVDSENQKRDGKLGKLRSQEAGAEPKPLEMKKKWLYQEIQEFRNQWWERKESMWEIERIQSLYLYKEEFER